MKPEILIETAKSQGNPIIQDNQVILVWQGKTPPVLLSDLNNWDENDPLLFKQISPDIWIYETALPEDAYLEYAFIIARERVRDPFNPRLTPNGIGKFNNYFYMPAAAPTRWAHRSRESAKGRLKTRVLPTFGLAGGKERSVILYQPPVEDPVPALVVWDGSDYLKRARLVTIVENLLQAGRIEPIALIMIPNGRQSRTIEYACSDATVFWLEKVVWPAAEEELRLVNTAEQPGVHGVLGASMGGLMALYTALRLPHRFGKVISQSGAFRFEDFKMTVWDLLTAAPERSMQIWLDIGRYEGLYPCNEAMRDHLKNLGYRHSFHVYNGGHNYPAWRDDLPAALCELFPDRKS